ncbi:MAG: flavin reductase family protein [Halobacteriovoraceae bacterium]|nr:flavin reductase family protein [Halobacteriovoraceae bacterium]
MKKIEDIAIPVGKIPSGLFIICAKSQEGVIDGFLGSWVQQVSFNPLLVSLCVKAGRPASETILKKEKFSINIVGEHDKSFLKHFWSGYDANKNPFSEIEHVIDESGAVVMKSSLATLVCEPISITQPGDHNLVVAKVIDSHIQHPDATPMVHTRKSGLSY